MLGRLILLFLLTPAVELALLIQVDQLIGFWATIALIIVTGVVGSHLARREGLSTWGRLNRRLQAGDLPGKELADGVIILVSGALLITPGILTDVIGFSGLQPAVEEAPGRQSLSAGAVSLPRARFSCQPGCGPQPSPEAFIV